MSDESTHRLLWLVLGVIPFGEDDRAGWHELLLLLICLLATGLVLVWTRRAHIGPTGLVDGIGSVMAAGAVGCELLAAQRLFWTLVLAAAACAGYLRHLDRRCVVCTILGARQHRAH